MQFFFTVYHAKINDSLKKLTGKHLKIQKNKEKNIFLLIFVYQLQKQKP